MKNSKPTGIKSWPLDDRPREKLLKKGSGALSNSELLAILLRTGTKVKRPWYRCSSKGVSYIQCNNASVSAESISKQVWDIVDVVKENLNVLEELNDMIKLNASQPEQGFLDELEGLTKQLNKNLEKQKGLFEVFSQDSINLEIYKDRADLLRNEERKLRQDIKSVQLKILDKRNTINLTRATQDFLLLLRKLSDNEQIDFLIKTFIRIVFKAIYIQNQEIVSFELNEPWQTCYDEGLKYCHSEPKAKNLKVPLDPSVATLPQDDDVKKRIKWNRAKTTQITPPPTENIHANSACYWKPTAAR